MSKMQDDMKRSREETTGQLANLTNQMTQLFTLVSNQQSQSRHSDNRWSSGGWNESDWQSNTQPQNGHASQQQAGNEGADQAELEADALQVLGRASVPLDANGYSAY